jgi:hypothetical protein
VDSILEVEGSHCFAENPALVDRFGSLERNHWFIQAERDEGRNEQSQKERREDTEREEGK